MKQVLVALALAVSVAACGDTNLLTGGGTAPSTFTAPTQANGAGRIQARSVDPNASCPDGHAPTGLAASSNRDAVVAYIQWNEVLGVTDYSWEVERYLPTNVYQLVRSSSTELLNVDVPTGQGHFRVHVRTRVCDSQFSPWSEWVRFTVGEDSNAPDPIVIVVPPPMVEVPVVAIPPVVTPPVVTPPVVIPPVIIPPVVVPPVVVPPVVVPPVVTPPEQTPVPPVVVPCPNGDHNNDGHCDSGNPPENPGGDNGNGNPPNGGGGNGGGVPPGGSDNGSNCSIHTSGKPATPPGGGNGGGAGNPPDADHNDDGHNDCGVGATSHTQNIVWAEIGKR